MNRGKRIKRGGALAALLLAHSVCSAGATGLDLEGTTEFATADKHPDLDTAYVYLEIDEAVLLADEPTGALDQSSGKDVLKLFHDLNRMGNTIVMITHDLDVAKNAQRIVRIVDGQLLSEEGDC